MTASVRINARKCQKLGVRLKPVRVLPDSNIRIGTASDELQRVLAYFESALEYCLSASTKT